MFEDIFSKKPQHKQENKPVKITADNREKNSLVISELASLGVEVEIKHLKVADFIVKDVAIERKTVSDFLNSMINKRLLRQLEELKQYPNKLLVIEGLEEQELYNEGNSINPNAIRGFLLSILLKHKIPVIMTKNYEDTAHFLVILAKKHETEMSIRARKKVLSKKEQLQYILEGFPGIGPKTAKKLLKKYKTIKKIMNLDYEKLKEDIGKKAEIFFKLLKEKY